MRLKLQHAHVLKVTTSACSVSQNYNFNTFKLHADFERLQKIQFQKHMAKMPFGMREYTSCINYDFNAVTLELKQAALVHTSTHVHILRAVWLLAQVKL